MKGPAAARRDLFTSLSRLLNKGVLGYFDPLGP